MLRAWFQGWDYWEVAEGAGAYGSGGVPLVTGCMPVHGSSHGTPLEFLPNKLLFKEQTWPCLFPFFSVPVEDVLTITNTPATIINHLPSGPYQNWADEGAIPFSLQSYKLNKLILCKWCLSYFAVLTQSWVIHTYWVIIRTFTVLSVINIIRVLNVHLNSTLKQWTFSTNLGEKMPFIISTYTY